MVGSKVAGSHFYTAFFRLDGQYKRAQGVALALFAQHFHTVPACPLMRSLVGSHFLRNVLQTLSWQQYRSRKLSRDFTIVFLERKVVGTSGLHAGQGVSSEVLPEDRRNLRLRSIAVFEALSSIISK